MGGNSSSFLTSADAERLESRSKKVQLQQMYAKQLSDDATLSGARTSRNHSIAGVAPGSVPGSRRGSSDRQGALLDSRDYVRPSSGTANGPGGGIFESMSEKDQLFAAAAKKKASQAEYYQQLQDADRRRSDPPQSSRVPLNRREQREDEAAAGRSSYGSRHSSRPGSDYSQRDQSEISGYAGQGYSSGAGPGSSHSRHTADGDLNTARRRQQEDYARALREDAQAAPIAESYSSRRRSNYDAEDYGGRNGGSGVSSSEKLQGNFSEKEEKDYEPVRYGRELTQEQGRYQTGEEDRYQERQSERYMEREPERRRQSGDDRYQEREQSGYQERASERGSGYNPSVGPPHNHGPSYDRSEEQSGMGTSRRSPRGDVPQGRQREGAYGGNISPDKEYDSRRAEEYSPPPSDQSRSRRNSEDIKKQYLFGSNSEGRSRQGGGEGGYIPESNYSNG